MNTILTLSFAFAVAQPAAPQSDRMLFGHGEHWVLLDGKGTLVKQMATFSGLKATDAAISPDGTAIVLTARNTDAQNELLYLWNQDPPSLRLLGRDRGYHAQPRFSRDGKWVVFGHNPNKGGRPGQHWPGANSQLYRIRPDGSRMEVLTDTVGCKLSPATEDGFEIFYIHSSCDIGTAIATLRAGGSERRLTGFEAKFDELTLTDDPNIQVVVENRVEGLAFYALRRSHLHPIAYFEQGTAPARPQWSRTEKAIFFQSSDAVWRLNLQGRVTKVLDLVTQ